jgi:hypothetical protein
VSSAPRRDIAELTRDSSFIFVGTVVQQGASNVRVLDPHPNLVLVRVHRGLRIDPALGDVRNRVVTLETDAPDELRPGLQAVFFTQGWIHGHELAVRLVAHADAGLADEVALAVEALPDMHLAGRIADATAIVHAVVKSVRKQENQSLERRAPLWAEARLEILAALKGDARRVRLLFPTSDSHHWFRAPRFRRGQRGIFLLHSGEQPAARWVDPDASAEVVTALDPADVQPESQLGHVRSLMGSDG